MSVENIAELERLEEIISDFNLPKRNALRIDKLDTALDLILQDTVFLMIHFLRGSGSLSMLPEMLSAMVGKWLPTVPPADESVVTNKP